MAGIRPDFENAFQALPVAAAAFDRRTGRVVAASQGLQRLTGWTRDQLVAQRVSELIEGGDGLDWDQGWWSSELCSGEATAIPSSDRTVVVRLRHRTAEPRAMVLTLSDVPGGEFRLASWQELDAARVELEELRRSDRRLRAIVDNTTAIVFAKDLDGRFLYVNRRFEELFGFKRGETVGRRTTDLFPANHAVVYEENDARVLKVKGTLEFEEQALHPEGMHTYLSLKFALRDEFDRPYAICGIATDITARKRMEAHLRESEERFRQLAENLRECVWVRDVAKRELLYVNPAYERIWGRPVASLYQNQVSWFDAVHPADRLAVHRSVADQVSRTSFEVEYRIVRPDGEVRWIHDRGVTICNEAGEVVRVAGIAEDITERRMLEHEVSEASRREQERISRELHDGLGQQLTGLSYLAASLAKRLQGADATSAALIRDGLKEALSEVRQVVQGLSPVGITDVGLSTALQRLAESVYNRFRIPCEFTHVGDDRIDDPAVATQLFRIAQEAVNNAVKHARPSRVEIRLESTVDESSLIVRDDGVGLAEGRSTDGLGLKIMRYRSGIIGAMFEVMSGADKGTTIVIRRQKDPAHEHEGAAGESLPVDAGR